MRPASRAAGLGRSTAGADLRCGVDVGEVPLALMRAGGGDMLVRREAGGVVAFCFSTRGNGIASSSSTSDDLAFMRIAHCQLEMLDKCLEGHYRVRKTRTHGLHG